MTENFIIYIDRLKDGQVQKIAEDFDPSFLEVDEKELQFKDPVTVRGEAYLTDDHLVIHLAAKAIAKMPCSVCNEMTNSPIVVDNFYHTEPLSEIRSAVYDFRLALREAILIELPRTIECNLGKCASRSTLKPFLRKEKSTDTHFPFSNIDLQE